MTPRSIGLLEISTHENFLANIANISHKAGYNTTIFTSKTVFNKISKKIETDNYRWIIKNEEDPISEFLSEVSSQSQYLDLLYSFPINGTIFDFFSYARFSPSCPFVLSVYNTNTWLMKNIRFSPKVYNYIRILFRKEILRKVDAITVEYDPIRQYVREYVEMPVYTMTPALRTGKTGAVANSQQLRVTIPGNIVSSRRQYDVLFEALTRMSSSSRDEIIVHLLGRTIDGSSDRIVNRINKLAAKGWDIRYHTKWVSINEFNEILEKSDILLSPLHKKKIHGISVEEYGKTKSSGVLADAIQSATPLILPEWFQVPVQLKRCTIGFNGPTELANILETISISKKEITALKRQAIVAADHYSIDNQTDNFRTIVDHCCSKDN